MNPRRELTVNQSGQSCIVQPLERRRLLATGTFVNEGASTLSTTSGATSTSLVFDSGAGPDDPDRKEFAPTHGRVTVAFGAGIGMFQSFDPSEEPDGNQSAEVKVNGTTIYKVRVVEWHPVGPGRWMPSTEATAHDDVNDDINDDGSGYAADLGGETTVTVSVSASGDQANANVSRMSASGARRSFRVSGGGSLNESNGDLPLDQRESVTVRVTRSDDPDMDATSVALVQEDVPGIDWSGYDGGSSGGRADADDFADPITQVQFDEGQATATIQIRAKQDSTTESPELAGQNLAEGVRLTVDDPTTHNPGHADVTIRDDSVWRYEKEWTVTSTPVIPQRELKAHADTTDSNGRAIQQRLYLARDYLHLASNTKPFGVESVEPQTDSFSVGASKSWSWTAEGGVGVSYSTNLPLGDLGGEAEFGGSYSETSGTNEGRTKTFSTTAAGAKQEKVVVGSYVERDYLHAEAVPGNGDPIGHGRENLGYNLAGDVETNVYRAVLKRFWMDADLADGRDDLGSNPPAHSPPNVFSDFPATSTTPQGQGRVSGSYDGGGSLFAGSSKDEDEDFSSEELT